MMLISELQFQDGTNVDWLDGEVELLAGDMNEGITTIDGDPVEIYLEEGIRRSEGDKWFDGAGGQWEVVRNGEDLEWRKKPALTQDELNALAESYYSAAYDCCFEERLAGCDSSIYYDAEDQTFWGSSSGMQEWCEFTANVTINDFDPMNTYENQDPGREEFVKMCMESFGTEPVNELRGN